MSKFECPGCGLKPFVASWLKILTVLNSYKCPGCESRLKVGLGLLFSLLLLIIISIAVVFFGMQFGLVDKAILPANVLNIFNLLKPEYFVAIVLVPVLKLISIGVSGFKV